MTFSVRALRAASSSPALRALSALAFNSSCWALSCSSSRCMRLNVAPYDAALSRPSSTVSSSSLIFDSSSCSGGSTLSRSQFMLAFVILRILSNMDISLSPHFSDHRRNKSKD
ncbi:MAG: hypothetical protein AMJ65_03685 [Phycisphaerae bacterium SG8_4]|nr:MAG: hypothetical protein AMJ65_03685 [Phycisphaerae bacterium SG8_4]